MKQKQWFALAVHPDYPEREVQKDITKQAKIEGLSPRSVGRVILVRHKEVRIVSGVEQVHRVKSYPGYLILSLAYSNAVQVFVDGIRGVQGLLPLRLNQGPRPKPTALESKEAVELLLKQELAKKVKKSPYATAPSGAPASRTSMGYEAGVPVTMTGGPFRGFSGIVSKVLNRTEVLVSFTFMGKDASKVMPDHDLVRSNE